MRAEWRQLGVGIVVSLILAGSVLADGMVIPPMYKQVEETGQKAVIWWDGKKETLIVSTTFTGDTQDFAWVIPVPKRPEVTTTKDELFTALNEFTTPKPVDNYSKLGMMGGYLGADGRVVNSGVSVLETKRIDVYDIVILSASDTWSLRQWLQEHKYEYPTTKEHLLQSYVSRGWYFVAVKVADSAQSYAGSYLQEGHATPLKISFLSDQIVYPLKISGPAAVVTPTPRPYFYNYSYTTTSDIGSKIIAGYSFEDSMANWTRYSSDPTEDIRTTRIGLVSVQARFGQKSLVIADQKKPGDLYVYQSISGLVMGKVHTYSAYVRANAKQGTARLKVQRVGYSSEWESAKIPLTSLKEWTRIELPFNPLYENYEFYLIVNGMGAKDEVYWDGVQVELGSSATVFGGEKMPSWDTNTRNYCSMFDGDVKGCDTSNNCAYYYCSNQCWPEGTSNGMACPGQMVSYLQDQSQNIVIYVFADHKQTVPGWNTEYAGQISQKNIEKLAIEDSGNPWMDATKKMYLTKLTRSMKPAEMVDDVILRKAEDDKGVGGGSVGWGWNLPGKPTVILGLPVIAELGIIVYIWSKRRGKK